MQAAEEDCLEGIFTKKEGNGGNTLFWAHSGFESRLYVTLSLGFMKFWFSPLEVLKRWWNGWTVCGV